MGRDGRGPAVAVAGAALLAAAGGAVLLAAAGAGPEHPSAGLLTTAVSAALLGVLVLWHRPRHRMGRLLLAAGVLFGGSGLAATVLAAAPAAGLTARLAFAWVWLAQAPLVLVWVLLILGMPEGRIGPGWRRRFVVGAGLTAGALAVAQYLLAPPGRSPVFPPAQAPAGLAGPLAGLADVPVLFAVAPLLVGALPLIAVGGLVARFRGADAVGRQQLKWVLATAAGAVLLNLAGAAVAAGGAGGSTAGAVLRLAAEPLPPLGIALAVLRYRLWGIDVLVARSVAYGLLWLAVSAVFVGLALATGLAAGGDGVLLPITLALVVTVAAQPVRSRLERAARGWVYGARPEGYAVVTRYAEAVAGAEDGTDLARRISEEVRRALGAGWACVWLVGGSNGSLRLRPVADGAPAGPSTVLAEDAGQELHRMEGAVLVGLAPPALRDVLARLGPDPVAAGVPLRAAGRLVAVLTCGQPERRRLAEPDRELLDVLAAESALALRNHRLEIELRERLAQIEDQAEELRRSRRRLVDAQDGQRRRIERDLHDGVQQQLVTLAARLRRAALAAGSTPDVPLRELADAAEESVFALQDLARGIYPGVLVDQGLVAALRAQAARVAAVVHVEVEPALAGRRLPAETEAACYFVALEAVTNALKHAPGASVTVSLHRSPEQRGLVLEVHDDGPGFDPARDGPGSGLQNMSDRIAAVGGLLSVDSRPGAGTWLRAEVGLDADVLALQREAPAPRR